MHSRPLVALIAAVLLVGVFASGLANAEPAATSEKPFFEKQSLFEAGHDGYLTYRIPSLVMTRKGTLLAAAAARYDGHGDWSNIDTMFRRSTDGGETWTPQEILTDDGQNVVDNATFIVDPKSDKVYLMYHINYDRAYLKISDDEGERWSSPREITSAFEEFRERDGYDWEVIAMGPGHGIVTEAGRMVVPVWLATSHKHRPSIAATIYSDDQGQTWHAGEVIAETTAATPNPSEHVVIQLADGRVMDNLRTESPKYRRFLSYSPDGATNWTEPKAHDQLVDPICMGSMATLASRRNGDAEDLILFSNPNNDGSGDTEAATKWGAKKRKNVTIRVSADQGKTWPESRVIEPSDSGYSDIAVGPDKTIYLLYESGKAEMEGSFIPTNVYLAKFNRAWIAEGDDPAGP